MTVGPRLLQRSDYHWVSEAVHPIMAQNWPWESQVAVKKSLMETFCVLFEVMISEVGSVTVAKNQTGRSSVLLHISSKNWLVDDENQPRHACLRSF